MHEKESSNILNEYTKPGTFQNNSWIFFSLIILFIILFFLFKNEIIEKPLSSEELKSSLEIFNISSHWVVKKEIKDDDFEGIILVPEIHFQVRNVGNSDLKYVFFLGVFRFLDSGKTIGEGFKMGLKKALPPGQISHKIKLTSGLGYRASSKDAFEKHQKDWQSSFVEVFIKRRSSQLTFFKSYYISRKIEGMNIKVRI
ncbi:MAG: hypothetical protein KAT17_09115 [Candidatus Aminicenantes bacterium]|nr:hypothetical protein [Candidatus Aminicenantes bacterium]